MDKNLAELLKGSSFNSVAKAVGILCGFVGSYIVASTYGAALVGKIATISSVFTLLALISLVGNQTLVLKLIPKYIAKYNHFVALLVFKRLIVVTTASAVIVVGIWSVLEVATPFSLLRGLEQYYVLVGVLALALIYKRMNTKVLRGLGDYKIYSLYELAMPVLLVVTTVVAVIFNINEGIFQYFYFFPLVILSVGSFYFVHKIFEKNIVTNDLSVDVKCSQHIPSYNSIVSQSFPMFGITLSNALIAHSDILMLNFYDSAESVGIYSIYIKISMVSAIATSSINAMFAPTVSRLYSNGDMSNLRIYAKRATLISFLATLLLTSIILFGHEYVLALYGDIFLSELPTLYLIVSTTLAGSFFGSVGLYLNMTGHQKSFFKAMLFAALLNVVLNVILIPAFGMFGAAIATVVSVLSWNVLATRKILEVHRFTLIWSGGKYV